VLLVCLLCFFWLFCRFIVAASEIMVGFLSPFSGCFAGLFIGRQMRLGFVGGEQNRGLGWRVVQDSLLAACGQLCWAGIRQIKNTLNDKR